MRVRELMSTETRRPPIRIEARGLTLTPRLRGTATRRLARALAALEIGVMRARLVFTDDNGPKGGLACRCALTLALSKRQPIHVEHTAPSAALAFDGALARLEHRLGRVRGLARDRGRRPKKYYVAARLWA